MANNIILIGFMGVGKGRTARALAEKTGETARLKERLADEAARAGEALRKAAEAGAAREARLAAEMQDLRSQLEEKEMLARTLGDNIASLVGKNEEFQRIMFDERHDYEEQSRKFCEEIGRLRSDLKWRDQETARMREELFDAVLLDAPCSGLGTLGRNPDIRWSSSMHELRALSRMQTRLLEHAAYCLKPGGVLVYSVCSPEPEETEAVVKAFLTKNRRSETSRVAKGKAKVRPADFLQFLLIFFRRNTFHQ